MIYIGPAFNANNLYLVFKIASCLSRDKGFKKLLIDSESDCVYELNSFDINYTNSLGGTFEFRDTVKSILVFFKILLITPVYTLRSKNRYYSILLHSAWDMARLKSTSLNMFILRINFFSNLLRCIKYGILYEKFIYHNDLKIAFVSHDVYQYKLFNYFLNKSHVQVYLVTNFAIGKYGNIGRPWFLRLYVDYCDIKQPIADNLDEFWINRQQGKSIYADAARNYVGRFNSKSVINGANVIFLHVFRDSPFLDIDSSRIFIDYFDWFKTTLKLINGSNERWLIKAHPSSERWGSNDNEFILDSIKKYCPKLVRDNKISIITEDVSTSELIDYSNRIITFGGTILLESIAKGKKPVIISYLDDESTGLSLFGSFLKPNNLKEYRNFLILGQDICIRDQSKVRKAKEILYIREDLFNLSEPFKLKYIYRGDPTEEKSRIFKDSVIEIDKEESLISRIVVSIISGKPILRLFN